MDFYDEEYEKNYKPSYNYIDDRTKILVDLSIVALLLAGVIELFRLII
jgi:hypothetical protein